MGIKDNIKSLFGTLGITLCKIIGLTTFVTGATIDNPWLMLAGIALVDLTPSFIKAIYKDIWLIRK